MSIKVSTTAAFNIELADTLSRHAVNSAVHFSARNNPHAQQLEVLITTAGFWICVFFSRRAAVTPFLN
jgi:hypothetical protein